MTDSTNSLKAMVDVDHIANNCNPSLCVTARFRLCVAASERFLQSEICQGSTAPKGRCPPGALALHSERSQEGLVLLDSHLLKIMMYNL